ncbi:hypothetical protein KI688_003134 [Linnemannia hyalina]|uniref:Pentatricopeptide repeat-containing protein n=1 Tax=Linnemannia hyalina TaxID=64524 RepID=A0A9P7XRF6_9FUNG|nr:hypothetical protein KI688_003134 [Linnemannia hyalina]
MKVGDFNTLITRALRGNQFANVPIIMQDMQERGVLPNVTTFIAMIDVNIKMSKLTEARKESIEILKNIINGEILPNRISLLSASMGEIESDGLMVIRETMAALGLQPDQINPDALTYSVVISVYPQNGDLRYVMEWYYTMLDGGFKPAPFMMNNLMSALHGSGQGMQILAL